VGKREQFFELTFNISYKKIYLMKQSFILSFFLFIFVLGQAGLNATMRPSSWYPFLIQALSAKFKFDYPPIATFTDRFHYVEFGAEDTEEM